MKRYVLQNRDQKLLTFTCMRNVFDEPVFQAEPWTSNIRPIGFEREEDLALFLERRKAPKHRRHIEELLRRYGCDDLEGFVRVTHALSLNDTFWVKEDASPLTWADVSLYRNEFDQLISEAAFDGTISDTELSSTSPEFGTDGCFAKCWVREADGIFLCKRGSAQLEIEPLSEYLAYQLAREICPYSIPYDLAYYHGKLVSKCRLFTDEETGLAKAGRIFGKPVSIPELLDYFEGLGSGDAFRRMCVLDALILNPDRHYGNFGVLFDTETMEILKMAPVFDNNRGLLPELDDDQLRKPDWYIQRCTPKLGRDFIVTAKGLLTDDIRRDLKRLNDFCFRQHPQIRASRQRLDALSSIVRNQAKKILESF